MIGTTRAELFLIHKKGTAHKCHFMLVCFRKHSTVYFIYSFIKYPVLYLSFVCSVSNALSQPNFVGDSRLCFVSRSVLMSSPELTRVCRHVLLLASSGPCGLHLALDWPSLSLTQFCRASASAKPLVTYMLFQQVSCDISAENLVESPLMSFS